MTNLSKRVEKAKSLTFSHNPHSPGQYSTWGSDLSKKYYHITLSHTKTTIQTPDNKKSIVVLKVECKKDTGNGVLSDCPGNQHSHTVCYHSLGALYQSFKGADKLISFFETYESAVRMSFSGKIVKVQSLQGPGFVWATIKDWPKPKLGVQENINLMRGNEEDEGID